MRFTAPFLSRKPVLLESLGVPFPTRTVGEKIKRRFIQTKQVQGKQFMTRMSEDQSPSFIRL